MGIMGEIKKEYMHVIIAYAAALLIAVILQAIIPGEFSSLETFMLKTQGSGRLITILIISAIIFLIPFVAYILLRHSHIKEEDVSTLKESITKDTTDKVLLKLKDEKDQENNTLKENEKERIANLENLRNKIQIQQFLYYPKIENGILVKYTIRAVISNDSNSDIFVDWAFYKIIIHKNKILEKKWESECEPNILYCIPQNTNNKNVDLEFPTINIHPQLEITSWDLEVEGIIKFKSDYGAFKLKTPQFATKSRW